MEVTVEVAGGEDRTVEVGEEATYSDLVAAVDMHPQEVSVLVDGRPVPGDQPVEADSVTVLQLIKGG